MRSITHIYMKKWTKNAVNEVWRYGRGFICTLKLVSTVQDETLTSQISSDTAAGGVSKRHFRALRRNVASYATQEWPNRGTDGDDGAPGVFLLLPSPRSVVVSTLRHFLRLKKQLKRRRCAFVAAVMLERSPVCSDAGSALRRAGLGTR